MQPDDGISMTFRQVMQRCSRVKHSFAVVSENLAGNLRIYLAQFTMFPAPIAVSLCLGIDFGAGFLHNER